jgi:hypothetical protein
MLMHILYSDYLTYMYIYLCEKVQNTVCLVATYRYCYCHTLISFSALVQFCLLMFRFAAFSHIFIWITLQKEWDPQQEQNSLLQKNGVTLYEQHDVPPGSYTTGPRHRAFVNGATSKWCAIGVYRTVTATCSDSDKICWWVTELWSGLWVTRVLFLLTRGWKSVSSKQYTVKLTLLYNCCVLLFNKFARMFHVALCGELLFGDGLQKSDVSQTISFAFIRPLYNTYNCALMVALYVAVAPHSPFSYCPWWSGFKRLWHPELRTFSVAHSGWCWRVDALGHFRRLYQF